MSVEINFMDSIHRKYLTPVLLCPNGDPSVRVGPLMSIPQILTEYGIDPVLLFADTGFKVSQFDDPDKLIPYAAGSILLERCVEATSCEHLGLLIGVRADPSSLGLVGYILQSARNVNTALNSLLRHLDLHDQGGTAFLVKGSKVSSLGYEIHLSEVHAHAQILDLSITMICNIMHALCGPDWKPLKVLIGRPAPPDDIPYQQFFQAPIEFGATQSAVIFPSNCLKLPLKNADPALFEFLEKKASELRSKHNFNLLDMLHRFISNTLVSGQCTASSAARFLGLHVRTLNRHLGKQGTSFQQELNKIRYEKACNLLTLSNATTVDIAYTLGYSDGTAFNHAFKKWTGTTPKQWRENRKAGTALKHKDQ